MQSTLHIIWEVRYNNAQKHGKNDVYVLPSREKRSTAAFGKTKYCIIVDRSGRNAHRWMISICAG